jgi:hypothetical protein
VDEVRHPSLSALFSPFLSLSFSILGTSECYKDWGKERKDRKRKRTDKERGQESKERKGERKRLKREGKREREGGARFARAIP